MRRHGRGRIRCRVADARDARGRARRAAPRGKGDAKVIVVMPARNAARTLEATLSTAIPHGWVDEIILVDDKSTDDTVELARRLPLHVVWHPAQRRLRRQPEDLLPRGAPARRRRRRDAAPRRPVRARDHPAAGRADRRRRGRHRARLALPRARAARARAGCRCWKCVANRVPDHGREPAAGHRPLRAAHRLPRLLARAAARRSRSCATRSTSLRLRAADAGRPLRLPHPRGARAATTYFDDASLGLAAPGRSSTASRRCGRRRAWSCTAGIWRSRKFMP